MLTRPVTLKFRREVQLDPRSDSDRFHCCTVPVGTDFIGFVPAGLPPDRMVVNRVGPGSWADQAGIRESYELVKINGKWVQPMSADECKKLMRSRPLDLSFNRNIEPPSVSVTEWSFTVPPHVQKLGFRSLGFPPDSVVVGNVDPDCWADSVGLRVGDSLIAVNGHAVSSMTKRFFTDCMQQRPLQLDFQVDR